eukprot:c4203_g1_i1 orf=351-779(+)
MARPVYEDRVHGELAALKILLSSSQEQLLDVPLPQLDDFWHYECGVSPLSPAARLQYNPASPQSPAGAMDYMQSADCTPRSCSGKLNAVRSPPSRPPSMISPLSPRSSPRSHAATSTAATSALSRFAPPPAPQALQHVCSSF